MREESEAVNESFWDATGVEIEAKQVLGKNARHGLTWIFWGSEARVGIMMIFCRCFFLGEILSFY